MSIRYYDISRPLNPSTAVWPGDTPFDLQSVMSLADGDSVNVTSLLLSSHFATHVDAPYHFEASGATMEAVPLPVYWGPAQVATITRRAGPLTTADFIDFDLTLAPRLLIHSPVSNSNPAVFQSEFVYPDPDLPAYLAAKGIILFGTDAPSVDNSSSKMLPGHHALHQNGIFILEGLNLSGVPDGVYELAAFPLRIEGGDGSPVRAVLRELD